MSTVELILKKASALPDALQQEALHYVDYLLARQAEGSETRQRTRFSAEQLEPVWKLRGALRRGILAVAKAASSAHPRSGL